MSKFQCFTVLAVVAVFSANLMSQDKTFVRASQISGMEIRNADNQKVGTIEDVILDQQAGTVAFAVVATDSSLNAGDKLLAIPWSSMKAGTDSKALVLNLPNDRLLKAPMFEKNAWPDMNAQWTKETLAFYGATMPTTARETVQGQPMTHENGHVENRQNRENGQVENGQNRENRQNRENGQVENGQNRENGNGNGMSTNRDADNGRREVVTLKGKVKSFEKRDPATVVIVSDRGEIQAELGPMSFLEQHHLALEPDADLNVRGYETTRDGRRIFVVTEVVSKDGKTVKLRRDDFTPMWVENRATNADRSNTANGGYAGTNTGVNPDIRDLTGTVTYIETGDGCGEAAQGRLVTVRTDSGERVVALGPGTYLAKNRWDLRQSDTVAVRGFETTRDGKRVFIATEVKKGNETWKLRREDGSPLW